MILGIIGIVVNLVYTYMFSTAAIIATLAVLLVAGIVLCIWPAIRSSRRTGKIGSGIIAGIVSACVAFLIGYGFNIYLSFMAVDRIHQNALTAFNAMQRIFSVSGAQFSMTNAQIQQNATNITGAIFAIIIFAIIGLIFGLIGGGIGRSQSRRA